MIAGPLSLVVDDAGDGSDTNPGDRVCTSAGGGCTLRAALDDAPAPTDQRDGPIPAPEDTA